MKNKRIVALIGTVMLFAALNVFGISAYAASETKEASYSESDSVQTEKKRELTDEEKAELKAKMDAMKAKWGTLTDAQKEEVYTLAEQAAEAQNKIIDKLVENGVIDKETATKMKEGQMKRIAESRENGSMPGVGSKGKHHDKSKGAADKEESGS